MRGTTSPEQHDSHSSHGVTPCDTDSAVAPPAQVHQEGNRHPPGRAWGRAQQVVQRAATQNVNGYELAPSGSGKRQMKQRPNCASALSC